MGLGVGGQSLVVGRGPAAVDPTRSLAARPTGPLVGRGARHRDGHERAEPAGQVGPGHPGEPGVHDRAHPRDSQAALGDRGREHHAPPLAAAQRLVLCGGSQPPVQRHHVEPAQPCRDGPDLPGPGQEDQQVAVGLGMGAADHVGHVVQQARVDPQAVRRGDRRRRRAPHHRHVVQRPDRLDDGDPAQRLRQPGGLGGRRHGQQQQVLPQRRAHVDGEREGQVGVQMAFVALVEHDRAGPRELGVALHPAYEHAGRHHLDPGGRPDGRLAPDRVTDAAPRRLAQQRAHPAGGSAGGHAPRLGHDHPSGHQAGEREGDERGLAGAGRGHQDRRSRLPQRVLHRRQAGPDRQVGAGGPGRWQHPTSLAARTGAAGWRSRSSEGGVRVPGGRPGLQHR